MDPWTPPHLKGKKCLPLLAHRTRPTWYLSNHVFNTATVYPSYFWKNYDKTSHNCTSDPIIITDLKGKQKHEKLVFLQEDFRNTPSQRRSPAPQLDRLVPERVSKRSSLSLDLNANENGVSEESGSESEEEGDKMPLRAWCVLKTCGFVFCGLISFLLFSLLSGGPRWSVSGVRSTVFEPGFPHRCKTYVWNSLHRLQLHTQVYGCPEDNQ